MDIDNKLREILRNGAFGHYIEDDKGDFCPLDWSGSSDGYFDTYIARIKQAFADEGWSDTNLYTKDKLARFLKSENMMTGQEWYNRFKKELQELYSDDPFFPLPDDSIDELTFGESLDAARKAGGIQ